MAKQQEKPARNKRAKRGWGFRILKYAFLLVLFIIISLGAIGGWLVYVVIPGPSDEILPENIDRILAVESPVFYADGKEKIGVFFEEAHREYVQYRQVPEAFINSLLAAEDNAFFQHRGVDFVSVFRALAANLRAGRVVQGGSTITQQTAKNLFKRRDRSIHSKLQELIYALRLEYYYPKEKILEFYVNQFFVSGNGHGIGMAARYYFDKKVEDLDLLESAFIAGSLKRPNYYNPFNKREEESRQAALKQADIRAKYILKQMHKLGMIDTAEYEKHHAREIPFRQGKMSYPLDTVMDLVKSALEKPEVEEALAGHGIDNVATSGIRIITTVKKDFQEESLMALRKELSLLDVQLAGYDREGIQKMYRSIEIGETEPRTGAFLLGRIVRIEKEPKPNVFVSFNSKSQDPGVEGIIDRVGFDHILEPFSQHTRNKWATATASDLPALLGQLQEGDLVYVHLRSLEESDGLYRLDLEKYPEIQGGAIVLEDGAIRAMVGGNENIFFNRAITARRPMGSVMKPIVYFAALQLGWNVVDLLHNERNLFIFQNNAYFPRPDHDSPFADVSMTWAGTLSENVATVWLLYHLCDRLSPSQFNMISGHLGLGRGADESYQKYSSRIRDKWGILVNREALYRAGFSLAQKTVEPDLLFDGHLEEVQQLRRFQYDTTGFEPGEESGEEESVRRGLLSRNFIRFRDQAEKVEELVADLSSGYFSLPSYLPLYRHHEKADIYSYWAGAPPSGWYPVSSGDFLDVIEFMDEAARERFTGGIFLEGVLRVETVKLVATAMEREYNRLSGLPAYSEEVLYSMPDFRVLVALKYLIGLCRAMGIESPLEPVLSFPLGSNVITPYEAARAYEAISTGAVTLRGEENGPDLFIVERIEDRDGEVLYQPAQYKRRLAPPQIAMMVDGILRNVILHGTGKYAEKNVRLRSNDPKKEALLSSLDLRVPLLGKTGTSNRFTNSAFVGVLPGPMDGDISLSVDKGYTVGVYVGYDDNRPMVHKTIRISGSAGALPVWTRIVNAIIRSDDYAGKLEEADLTFHGEKYLPLAFPRLEQKNILLDPSRGGIPLGIAQSSVDSALPATISFGEVSITGIFNPGRMVVPYWQEYAAPSPDAN